MSFHIDDQPPKAFATMSAVVISACFVVSVALWGLAAYFALVLWDAP